jgi:PAS domain S-box-containing protein
MLCGASVLYGWAMDIEFLKRVETGLASMNPMTASAFILAGLTLALQYRAAGSGDMEIPLARRLTVKICAVILLIFGVLVVSNYFLGRGFAVDQILFSGKLTDELTGIRSQTAPSTALCLIFASLALLFLDVTPKRGFRPAELLAIAIMFVALFGIEIYLFGIGHNYSAELFSSMALHTAVLLLMLAYGIFCVRPRVGLMSLATSDYPGVIILIWGYPLIMVTAIATAFLQFEGVAHGFFGEVLGAALFTLINIFVIGVLLLSSARLMRNAERKRQQSEDERKRFFDLSVDLTGVANLDGYFKQVNTAFITTLGHSRDEVLSRPYLDFVHPEDVQATLAAIERLTAGDNVMHFLNRIQCKDGAWRDISWTASGLPELGEIYVSGRDITDFLVVQNALNAREEELSITLKSIGDGVLSTDIEGRITRLNTMAEHLTGWTENEAIGQPVEAIFSIFNELTREPAVIPVIETLATGATRELANHTVLVSRDGIERPIADSCAPIHNREGTVVGAVLTFRDVSQQRSAARELRSVHKIAELESERLNTILDSVVDGVISFNASGEVKSFNSAAERLYGYKAAEVIGHNIRMLAPAPFQDEFDDYIYTHNPALSANAGGIHREVLGLHKDGHTIPVEISVVETTGSSEWGFTGVVRDVSERTRFIEELKSAREQAEAANTAKSQFLAAMSHEIRTPMNGVIGMLDVLHETSLKDYQVEMVELIQDSADSLLTIINDILDLSKIEAGKMELHPVPFDITSSVENVCVIMDRFAEKLHIDLIVFIDPAMPASLLGDAQHLRQVLINLINNAVKFCSKRQDERGRVSVRMEMVGHEENKVIVEFRVKDNGIGMDAATQAQLFAPFEQGRASIGRIFGGTGLGLAISHNLTRMMGGDIQVESEFGVGSTFTVRLPFCMDEQPSLNNVEPAELAGLFCLVVGQQDGLAPDLTTYLSYSGATVERIDSLYQAQAWARDKNPEQWVWVIDAGDHHPSIDELKAATGSKSKPDVCFLAVVIERGKRHNLRQKDSGVFMVDGNALRRKTLVHAVAVAAGRKSLEQKSAEPTDTNRQTAILPISRDKAIEYGRLILVAEDNEINQRVIVKQLALIGVVADIASTGVEALELWRNGSYPVMVTDLQMPGMDGYELTAAIRAEEDAFKHMGIVALTANALSGEAEQCLLNGMDDYLSKPARLQDIENVLNKWLPPIPSPSTEPERENIMPQTVSLSANQPHSTDLPVDVNVLKKLVGDDPEIVRELLEDFRHNSASISSDLHTAWQSADFKNVGAAAHKLKSSARTVGAMALGEMCEKIETAVTAERFEHIGELIELFNEAIAEVDRHLQSYQNNDTPL